MFLSGGDVTKQPAITSVWPNFGPQAGGTLVTFTGQNLDQFGVPRVYFSDNGVKLIPTYLK